MLCFKSIAFYCKCEPINLIWIRGREKLCGGRFAGMSDSFSPYLWNFRWKKLWKGAECPWTSLQFVFSCNKLLRFSQRFSDRLFTISRRMSTEFSSFSAVLYKITLLQVPHTLKPNFHQEFSNKILPRQLNFIASHILIRLTILSL